MIRTEEEARKCWCPFARVAEMQRYAKEQDESIAAVNRGSDGLMAPIDNYWPHSCCIASQCMAWRWGLSVMIKEGHAGDPPVQDEVLKRGYCGLAGAP